MKTEVACKYQTGALKKLCFAYFLSNYQMKKQIGIKIDENLVCSQEQQSDHVHAS